MSTTKKAATKTTTKTTKAKAKAKVEKVEAPATPPTPVYKWPSAWSNDYILAMEGMGFKPGPLSQDLSIREVNGSLWLSFTREVYYGHGGRDGLCGHALATIAKRAGRIDCSARFDRSGAVVLTSKNSD